MINGSIPVCELKPLFPNLTNILELKNGGQKAVYTASHDAYGEVVLKLLSDIEHNERVLREIEIVRKNNFPNVPIIYEVNTVETREGRFLYIIEQRIVGNDLRTLLNIQGTFSLPRVLGFIRSLLVTVAELEKKGIVHRDIKPDNVLLDNEGRFWLIDFGIARDLSNISLTATSAHFGPYTAGYAPPEQFQNMKRLINSRTDLFSIGVTAYEMLHGKNPFLAGANSVIDVLMKTVTVVEEPLRIPGDTNSEVAAFIKTLMQKNPTFRPPSSAMALSWFLEIVKTTDMEALQ